MVSIPESTNKAVNFLGPKVECTCSVAALSVTEVQKEVLKLKDNKATGPDEIPRKFMSKIELIVGELIPAEDVTSQYLRERIYALHGY